MHLGEQLAIAFGPAYNWSPSQLELYRQCAFAFFVSRALGVQAREEPEEGLDARQLGTIYHRIFERLFQFVPHEQRRDLAALNAALPGVADAVLDDAPQREGFRADALWEQTRARIKADVQRSLIAMEELDPDFTPSLFEVRFGGANALQLRDGDDSIRVRGIIDRVDVDAARRRLRVIDYKTAGPSRYTPSSLTNGENLQLPLYALAASRVFDMEIADGFYWHVRDASASDLRLAKYGVDEALAAGIRHAWEAVHAVRDGDFVPRPPRGGCPGYCPAVAFCWRYQPRSSW
jgi:ATP-dependent helicase/DNAse subunit B